MAEINEGGSVREQTISTSLEIACIRALSLSNESGLEDLPPTRKRDYYLRLIICKMQTAKGSVSKYLMIPDKRKMRIIDKCSIAACLRISDTKYYCRHPIGSAGTVISHCPI